MKVLDLRCGNSHTFEGWFASELTFSQQREQGMVQCPVCASIDVCKMLSAPRLNLATARQDDNGPRDVLERHSDPSSVGMKDATAAWMAFGRQILATTADVGSTFAEEARRMHYGEVQHRPIRGTSSLEEAMALVDEGVPIVPLLLPEALKGPLQ